MKTIRIQDNTVQEVVPHLPVETWYGTDFAAMCVEVDSDDVEQGWIYDPSTGGVSPPEEPEPEPVTNALSNEEITNILNNILGVK